MDIAQTAKKKLNKKRNRNQIVPSPSGGLTVDTTNLEMSEPSDKSPPGLYTVTKAAIGAKNHLKEVTSAKRAAGKWKNYITKKRKLESSDMIRRDVCLDATPGHGDSSKHGDGLDEIDTTYVLTAGTKKSTIAGNRALIQYFAKLGQLHLKEEELDLGFIESLINQGADVNCTDKFGQTIFHEVARVWHTDVAKFVLEHGGKINQADIYGRTPLHVAAAVDYADMCEFLIENGANKEAVTKGEKQTPLFFAARNDATKALAVLIRHRCEYKEIRDYRGRTPLFVAAELDRSETARLLLEYEAPVGVVDDYGQPALTFMFHKMAPVAKEALNQLHSVDRANRQQYFYLNHLEPIEPGAQKTSAQMPLEVLVAIKNYDLVLHPVILRLIEVKWKQYGLLGAVRLLTLNLVFILLWSIIALHSPWYSKCNYSLNEDIWKIIIYVMAVGLTIYQIIDELLDFTSSQKEHNEWKDWRTKQLQLDKEYCHPRWPEEKSFLDNEESDLDKFKSNYFSDFWNIFDWICYAFLLASTITHVIDVFVLDQRIALWHNRIMAINIIFVWIRTMKYVRCFSFIGPFIVMLSEMVADMCRWAFLYIVFFIPFAFAFWMVFGGEEKYVTVANNETAECIVSNLKDFTHIDVKGMTVFDEMVFTLFRLTLVDEYDLDNMLSKDKGMAYLLLTLWFWISSILFLNLFIALLSDTFQRVYDNAKSNAVMQKAITVLTIEDSLWKRRLYKYRMHIKKSCSPETLYYDDDTGEDSDELKKVTIQVKEQIDHLLELWHLKFGSPIEDIESDDEGERYYPSQGHDKPKDGDDGKDADSTGRLLRKADDKRSSPKAITFDKLENEVDILRAELLQVEKKRRDFERKCLSELQMLKSILLNQQQQQVPVYTRQVIPPIPVASDPRLTFDSVLPPAYPVTFGDRITPRDDQINSNASVSNVEIATVQHPDMNLNLQLPPIRDEAPPAAPQDAEETQQ